VYGYPVDKAAPEAVRAVGEFVTANPGAIDEVTFCAFDAGTEERYAEALQGL
jgi:O-acetyl-ADP-ribose deacetylase (regulator of RNase III)